ncbi:hypothetical protein [Millisia brevis]|uniref:hypothetical protein n=1 Tax=Millisia brevis TaxID=264148 RepID=UPI0012ED73C8|nr:hypothetical protein [Millisia brevis]
MIGTMNTPWIGAVVRPRAAVGATNAARGGALPAEAGIAFVGGTAAAGEAAGALRPAPRAPWVDDRKPGL